MASQIDRIALIAASKVLAPLGFTLTVGCGGKSPHLLIQKDGVSHRLHYPSAPRTDNTQNFVRQSARRLLRDWGSLQRPG